MTKTAYCTIAIHPLYRTISFKLIKSFLEYTRDSVLHIYTDDVEFYGNYCDVPNVFIEHIQLPAHPQGYFDLNIKYKMLQDTYEAFLPQYIVLTDCDMFFGKAIDNECFDTLPDGLSVPLGYPPLKIPATDFQNSLIRAKGLELSQNPLHLYHTFREGCLLFNTSLSTQFFKFCEEWEKMYNEVAAKGLTDCCQIFEINLACERSGYPLNNLGSHPLRGSLYYEERNGAIGTALA